MDEHKCVAVAAEHRFLTDLLPFNYNLLPFFNEFFMRY